MDGVTFTKSDSGACLCHVNFLSNELQEEIRSQLSAICYGAAKAASQSELYAYKHTLKEFLNRYYTKAEATKKGMIGELLTHVLLLHFITKYTSINPYFNMEEESIKKAFDLVLRNNDDGELWFSEVKSGEIQEHTSNSKAGDLLGIAKRGLSEMLNSSRHAMWQNAINGAMVTANSLKVKKEINDILEQCNLNARNKTSVSSSYNVILIAVVYNTLEDMVEIDTISQKHNNIVAGKNFKNLMTVAIQKTSYKTIEKFLEKEVEDG